MTHLADADDKQPGHRYAGSAHTLLGAVYVPRVTAPWSVPSRNTTENLHIKNRNTQSCGAQHSPLVAIQFLQQSKFQGGVRALCFLALFSPASDEIVNAVQLAAQGAWLVLTARRDHELGGRLVDQWLDGHCRQSADCRPDRP